MTIGTHNLIDGGRRMLDQERYLRVHLEHNSHDGHTHTLLIGIIHLLEIRTQTVHITTGMGLYIEIEIIIRIAERQRILVLIAQQRDTNGMDIITEVASQILIRICSRT